MPIKFVIIFLHFHFSPKKCIKNTWNVILITFDIKNTCFKKYNQFFSIYNHQRRS